MGVEAGDADGPLNQAGFTPVFVLGFSGSCCRPQDKDEEEKEKEERAAFASSSCIFDMIHEGGNFGV